LVDWLEKDLGGDGIEELLQSKLERDLEGSDNDYTTNRTKDEFAAPNITDGMRAQYKERREEANSTVTALTQTFTSALRARAMAVKAPHQRRGKLDARNIYKVAADTDCENVFFKMKPGEKMNTAVSILIDESGSMSGIMEKVVDTVMIVAEALDAIKVPFCMMGHSTKESNYEERGMFDRWNPLIMPVYKMFSEDWGSVKPRLMNAQGRANNADCEAVFYASQVLRPRKESRKILFVFSDGAPNSGNGDESKMARALIKKVKELRSEGVEVYNVSLGTTEPHKYYGQEFCLDLNPYSDSFGPELAKAFCDVLMNGRWKVG